MEQTIHGIISLICMSNRKNYRIEVSAYPSWQIDGMTLEELEFYFPEVLEICRKEALDPGKLDDFIDRKRANDVRIIFTVIPNTRQTMQKRLEHHNKMIAEFDSYRQLQCYLKSTFKNVSHKAYKPSNLL